MSRAGILIAIFALAALTLAPLPVLAQSLLQQAERPTFDRASVNTAPASRGRYEPTKPAKPAKPEKPYRPAKPEKPEKPAKPEKPYRPAKPGKPYKPGKHEEPDWCEPEAYCDTDEECHAMYPCKHTECETSHKYTDKTWPKQGKCVCEGDRYGPCAPYTPFPDDECNSIDPNIGSCYSGECKPIPRDEGCPCEDTGCGYDPVVDDCVDPDHPCICVADNARGGTPTLTCEKNFLHEGCPCANNGDSCKTDPQLTPAQLACLNELQPCKCGGNGVNGNCVPNYLPQGTVCDATDAGITLGVCEIAKCDGNNECKATNLDQGTGCFIGNNVQCENAGTCGPDPAVVIATPDDTYVCNSIECPPEPPVTGCNDRPDRGSLGQPCEISGGDEGICCVDPASGSDPKELKCVRKTQCPCLPDNNNPECPADQVCCDEGNSLGDPDNFVCKETCNAIPCASDTCFLRGSSDTEFAFAYCSNGCGSGQGGGEKQGCVNSCATCSTGNVVANNCNNVNSSPDPCSGSNAYCKDLNRGVSNCCICKNSSPSSQAGCAAPTS